MHFVCVCVGGGCIWCRVGGVHYNGDDAPKKTIYPFAKISVSRSDRTMSEYC